MASDFLYNWNSKEATTSVGYDYLLRQVRGFEKLCSVLPVSANFVEVVDVVGTVTSQITMSNLLLGF